MAKEVQLWDPWDQLCTCSHPLREHIADWDRPDDGITPDCRHANCNCMDFEVRKEGG